MTERRDMPETALHIAATILQRDFSEAFPSLATGGSIVYPANT
jgi:hypothetical protein